MIKHRSVRALTSLTVYSAAMAAALGGVLSSCSEDTVVVTSGAARITPHIIVDHTVVTPSGERVEIPAASLPAEADMSFSLEADDGRYTHTWASIADYPVEELLRPGDYTATAAYGSATSEGFGSPYFAGHARLHLDGGTESDVQLNACLVSSLIDITFAPHLSELYTDVSAVLHSEGYSYVTCPAAEERSAFIHPGNISLAISVTTPAGEEASIEIATIPGAASQTLYNVELRDDGEAEPTVTALVNGAEYGTIKLTQQLLAAPAPSIAAAGFTPGEPFELAEGNTPSQPMRMDITGARPSHLILSTVAPSLQEKGWPAQIDLATASSADLDRLSAMGLTLQRDGQGDITAVDLTGAMSRLRSTATGSEARFYLMATGANGKQSDPVECAVRVTPVEINVLSVSDILIGADIAEVVLVSRSAEFNDNLIIRMPDASGHWTRCEIETITQRSANEYAVTFHTVTTESATAPVRIFYCGELISEVALRRVSPDYSVEADPFAMTATLRITAADARLTSLITDLLRVYVNGSSTLVADRNPDTGTVFIGGLQPDSRYTLTTSLVSDPAPADLSAPIEIVTEKTLQVRNSSFEDHDDGIKYDNMPCGGRYSQTIADIFNCQNFTSFNFQQPRHWANTNAKTFCTDATLHNTWYLQPSVMSDLDNIEGYVAVKLQTVAWDSDGAAIPDYRQNATQYIPYNPNVPRIKYRAAGKLFLGKYTFDPKTLTETYTEGLPFSSRPVAINGMYHFTPSPADLSDRGMITVEVIGERAGKEISLAKATGYLPAALSYTAFSVPLSYDIFGVKATRLKIMISSSMHTGSIEHESSAIITSDNPKEAHSLGGTLWIQDLSLSYK